MRLPPLDDALVIHTARSRNILSAQRDQSEASQRLLFPTRMQ
jgi:hypothetical protein